MERSITFITCAQEESFKEPRIEIRVQFQSYNTGFAAMQVDIVESSHTRDRKFNIKSCVLHSQHVAIPDTLLAKAVNSCDKQTAESIAYDLFFRYVIEPSLMNEMHWLKLYAPKYWKTQTDYILQGRENQCRAVHDD